MRESEALLQTCTLGELYQRACEALHRTPEKEVTQALNNDDPKRALIELIEGITALSSTGIPAAAAASGRTATGNSPDAEPQVKNTDAFEFVAEDVPMRVGAMQSMRVEDSSRTKRELDTIWDHAKRAKASPLGVEVLQWLHAIAQMSLRGGDAQPYIRNAHEQLCQALEEQGRLATKRQVDRRAKRVAPGSELEHVVKEKLATPGMPLSPEDSRNCLVSCIEYGKVQAKHTEGKNVVVVVGNTGAGKSAFINLLHGCSFELDSDDRMAVRRDSAVKELMTIGHTNKSETFAPQVEAADASFGEGYAFADCPGFLDNRGFEINVANAVNVKQTLAAATSVHVVVIINYHSLLADRGKGVKDLFHILSGLFGNVENVKKHAKSVLLAISQAPATHPETGNAMSLDRHKKKLLDPTGLDETAKELLGAIGDASVFVYHLLGRGDASWLKRDAIIARIKGLDAITEPGGLFQSAISDEDKESLRNLVGGLGKQINSAIGAAGYDVAADVVSDLMELKLVQHSFVTTIVDEAVGGAIDDRMATVRSIVDRRGEFDGVDGDGPGSAPIVDAQKFEDARRELHSMSSVLAAFAGIAEVREKLKALLLEAFCQFESAVKEAAENAGRRAVEESLREVLRTVGDNVVREVLELPKAATAMMAKQNGERAKLEELQTEELRRLPELAPTEQVAATRDRHAIELQELSYRLEAANEAWQGHIDRAGTKLEQRDRSLLAEEGSAFWAKVGWSSERLRTEAGSIPVNWNGKKLADTGCEVMSIVFRELNGPPNLRTLFLSSNAIGVPGIMALSDATAFGALVNLEKLYINNNKIGDTGLAELSGAMAGGRLKKLIFLDLNCNQIGDLGVTALAGAIAGGAIPDVRTLYLHCNVIGDIGTAALASSLSSPGAMAKLERFWLYSNRIGEAGLKALSELIANGWLASLTSIQLEGNLAGAHPYEVQKSIHEMLKQRAP